jgi:hypothetical protein
VQGLKNGESLVSDSSSPPTPPGDASDPTLTILWGAPPAYTGNTGGASASSAAASDSAEVLVNLATMQAAEQGTLSAATEIVNAYNTLDQQVQADIAGGTIFGQRATYSYTYDPRSNNGFDVTFHYADTGLQQGAQEFAAQMNPAMRRVLRMIADGTESVGVYIALLDKAGQAYTAADKNSTLPPTPPAGS